MKVLFLDTVHPCLQDALEAKGWQCDIEVNKPSEKVQKIIGYYNGIVIRSRIPIDKDLLEKATNLKFIARSGAGLENIDLEYCKANNITCFNAPEGNRDAVGEHALGMLLSLFNNLNQGDQEIRNGIWDREGNRGVELQGKTVGIIGYGNTGSAFTQRLKGFDCKILAYDKYQKGFGNSYVKEAKLQQLFDECDVVSLHVPLTEETKFMVNGSFIENFKKPFYLINTARGKVVKTDALVAALKSKKVLGACLDVLEYESKAFDLSKESSPALDYLLQSDKVILSPHVAGWTVESYRKLSKVLFNKVVKYIAE